MLAGVAGTGSGIDIELTIILFGSAAIFPVNYPRTLCGLKGIMPVAFNADCIFLRV